jgi:hypothetical protein
MKVFYVTLYLLFVLSLTAKAQDSVKVALVQAHLAWGDVDANLRDFDKRVRSCKGCDMIVFPELFTSGCEMKKRDKEEAVCSKDGVASYYPLVIKRMRKWAKRSGALVVGSTIYKEEGKYYNRLLAVYPDGKYEYYDKHNCFKKGSFSPVIWRWNGKGYASRLIFVMTCASRSGVGIMESMMLQFILQIGRNPDETTGIDFCGNELSRMRRMSLPLIVPDRI